MYFNTSRLIKPVFNEKTAQHRSSNMEENYNLHKGNKEDFHVVIWFQNTYL